MRAAAVRLSELVLVALILWAAFAPNGHAGDRRATLVASAPLWNVTAAVGFPVYADSTIVHAGYASPDEIDLRWDVGMKLEKGAQYDHATGTYIYYLAHELGHVRTGSGNERTANRYAVRHYYTIARQLGFTNPRRLWLLCNPMWCGDGST